MSWSNAVQRQNSTSKGAELQKWSADLWWTHPKAFLFSSRWIRQYPRWVRFSRVRPRQKSEATRGSLRKVIIYVRLIANRLNVSVVLLTRFSVIQQQLGWVNDGWQWRCVWRTIHYEQQKIAIFEKVGPVWWQRDCDQGRQIDLQFRPGWRNFWFKCTLQRIT